MGIFYALSIGFNTDNVHIIDCTYENSSNFKPFPTNYLTLCHKIKLNSFPGLPEFEPMQLVHGEERLTIFKSLQFETEYTVKETIVDCLDNRSQSGTNVVIETQI